MMPKRNVYGYTLRDHYGKIVYVGITNDPRARVAEHTRKGNYFKHLKTQTGPMSRQEALRWESRRIKSYRDFTGRNPRYNKTYNGGFRTRRSRTITQRDLDGRRRNRFRR